MDLLQIAEDVLVNLDHVVSFRLEEDVIKVDMTDGTIYIVSDEYHNDVVDFVFDVEEDEEAAEEGDEEEILISACDCPGCAAAFENAGAAEEAPVISEADAERFAQSVADFITENMPEGMDAIELYIERQ